MQDFYCVCEILRGVRVTSDVGACPRSQRTNRSIERIRNGVGFSVDPNYFIPCPQDTDYIHEHVKEHIEEDWR